MSNSTITITRRVCFGVRARYCRDVKPECDVGAELRCDRWLLLLSSGGPLRRWLFCRFYLLPVKAGTTVVVLYSCCRSPALVVNVVLCWLVSLVVPTHNTIALLEMLYLLKCPSDCTFCGVEGV